MVGSNQETLQSYEARIREYVDGTSHAVTGAAKAWIDAALSGLPKDARILELGSAFGRDAAYMDSRGFRVECTDAVPGFVDQLRAGGFQARLFNALTDELAGGYDLILANAVLLHFTPAEFRAVLKKMAAALAPGGRFAFSLKRGQGESWSDAKIGAPRYFCYWEREGVEPLLAEAGFARWSMDAATTQRAHADWLFVVALVA